MSILTDIIEEETNFIKKPIEAIQEAIANEPEAAAQDEGEIDDAAEITANLYAMIIETPLGVCNSISYRVKKRKLLRNTKLSEKEKEKELKEMTDKFVENKDIINIDDAEFDRLHAICRIRAKRNGGKINETFEMVTSIVCLTAKRLPLLF